MLTEILMETGMEENRKDCVEVPVKTLVFILRALWGMIVVIIGLTWAVSSLWWQSRAETEAMRGMLRLHHAAIATAAKECCDTDAYRKVSEIFMSSARGEEFSR